MGASLLVFLNKTDVEGCMTEDEVREVSIPFSSVCRTDCANRGLTATRPGLD